MRIKKITVYPLILALLALVFGSIFKDRLNFLLERRGSFMRSRVEGKVNLIFPPDEAGLMAGIVLGSKKMISSDLYQKLKQTGTIHIVVASGTNLIFLSGFFIGLLTFLLKRKRALWFVIPTIWFYTLVVGFDPAIVRASMMASFGFLGEFYGRPAESKRIFVAAVVLMCLLDFNLVFNLGFQLSVAATAGLIFVQPLIKRRDSFLLKSGNFSTSLAAQITTLPILIYNFGEYNLLSPLINLLVIWTVGPILGFGILIIVLSFLSLSLAQILGYLVYPLLRYFVIVIDVFSKVKIGQVWMPKLGLLLPMIYYFGLVYGVWKESRKKKMTKKMSGSINL